jgi:hypothetical protein
MSDATFELELDRLEVERTLGAGAFGEVLLAREPGSTRPLALKLLRGADPRRLERFRREAQLTARLDHPGIVRVHGAGTYRGRPAIVYALVEGARPLGEAARTLPLAGRLALVRDVARALAFAHARGVVHRDLKAENVLVDADGQARLADFGLAVAVDSQTLTRTGQLVGTPYAMSPEQIVGQEATAASDVWALGVLLHLVVTGARPFEGEGWTELAAEVVRGRSARPSSLVAGVPPGLDDLVAAALQKEPAARPSATDVARALDELLAGRGVERRRALLVPALAGLAGLAVAVGLGALAARPAPPPGPVTAPASAPSPPAAALAGWAAELATVRSFSLVVERRAPDDPAVGDTVRLVGALGPVQAAGPLLSVPLRLSELHLDDLEYGRMFHSDEPSASADLPLHRYGAQLATASGALLIEATTGAPGGVTGLPEKPRVPLDEADAAGMVAARLGAGLPTADVVLRWLGNLTSIATGPKGERSLGRRELRVLGGDAVEAELTLEPAGPDRLRLVGRDVRRLRGPQGRRPTVTGHLRYAGGHLVELQLEAEVDAATARVLERHVRRRLVETLTLEPPTR